MHSFCRSGIFGAMLQTSTAGQEAAGEVEESNLLHTCYCLNPFFKTTSSTKYYDFIVLIMLAFKRKPIIKTSLLVFPQ